MLHHVSFQVLPTAFLFLQAYTLNVPIHPEGSIIVDSEGSKVILPTLPLVIGNQTVTGQFFNLTDDAPTCLPTGILVTSRRPKYQECALALRQLPSSPESIQFCTGPDRKCFLPVTKIHEKCRIIIQLDSVASTERSSWIEIGLAALELDIGCESGGRTGGSTRVGQNNNILIAIDKIR